MARGLGAMHKELSVLKVPFVLLGPVPAVQTVLYGAINTRIPEIFAETELDALLVESCYRLADMHREHTAPLLTRTEDGDVDNNDESSGQQLRSRDR